VWGEGEAGHAEVPRDVVLVVQAVCVYRGIEV
jgi:hypothetical protein